ncbi:MAG: hypothetical protein R8M14_09830 [Ghiorsea sp.]
MNENKPDKNTPIIDATPVGETPQNKKEAAPQDAAAKPTKKSRLKLHLILLLLLGIATWVFWTWTPQGQNLKTQIKNLPWFAHPNIPSNAPTHVQQSQTEDVSTVVPEEDITQMPEDLPEDVTDKSVLATPVAEVPLLEETPELIPVAAPTNTAGKETLTALTDLVDQLNHQMASLQDNISQMYEQQAQHNKQQVKAQVFTALQQATSPNSSIEGAATAWKSIALLPMLDESRRAEANQAWHELNGLSNDAQALSQDIVSEILSLADKLHPDDLADVADTVENLVDSYANTDAWITWLDWLEKQFKFTKVDTHAVVISDDPYADIKQLINQLDQLKHALVSGQWESLPDVDAIIHQLDQHGVSTTMSAETIQQMQQAQQAWQTKAKAWMEQL